MDTRWNEVYRFFQSLKEDTEIREIEPLEYIEKYRRVYAIIESIVADKDTDPDDRSLAIDLIDQARLLARHHIPEATAALSEVSQDPRVSQTIRDEAKRTLADAIIKMRANGFPIEHLSTYTPNNRQ